ncbi:MAG: nuclear transport factor 2 family protein [Polyangiales bacterium]
MPSDEARVLAANRAFYTAFCKRDLPAMQALWSKSAAVSCVHPGWSALHGREDVLASWEAILGHPDSPTVECLNENATVMGEAAVVTCEETIGDGALVATNVFVREEGSWKLAHHHSSGVADDDDDDEEHEPDPKMLN